MQKDFVSFYRKYRPRKVSELDITPVREFFGRVLESGKFAQAYLFTGPKGTGKTSAARILARTINCVKNTGETGKEQEKTDKLMEPCGECAACVAIEKGSSTAVVEIDAASNRGIDDIRALRERVGLMPTEGKFSVFIIDEVHMLTKEAFNALLKTLEEPPKHVVFCLCTTDEHKLPDTVVSRCTRVVYRKANDEEIARSLARVVAGEGLDVESEALVAIAKRADGSFRDAVKILEQLSDGAKINLTRVENEVGLSAGGAVSDLYETVRSFDAKKALDLLGKMTDSGVDVVNLTKNLLEICRQEVLKSVEEKGEVEPALVSFVEVFSKCFSRFADVPIESLPLEMAIVEYCGAVTAGGSGSSGEGQNATRKTAKITPQKSSEAQKSDEETKVVGAQVGPEPTLEIKDEGVIVGTIIEKEDVQSDTVSSAFLTLELVRGRWGLMLSELAMLNHGLVTILKGAELKDCVGDKLVLGVSYKFHKDQLEQDKYLTLVEAVAKKVFGGRVKLSIELSEKRNVSKVSERIHENIAVVSPEDAALAAAAEEIFS